MLKKWLTPLIFGVIVIAFLSKVYIDTNYFKVNRVAFHSNKVQGEFNILQISDLHNKIFGDNNEKLVETVENLNADIVILTGDLVDRNTNELDHIFNLIENITAIHEDVYFVSGNHEWGNAHYGELLNGLQERNVTILDNKNEQITANQTTLNIVGVDDSSTNHENIEAAFAGINEEHYTILLSHSPGIIEKYDSIPADLILSGHTHGGQVRIPFIGALIAPGQGLFPSLEKGTYQLKPNQHLYIDSGLGTSVAPIRFLNQSQLSLIRVGDK
ncbi:metallophosphoesterase [Virgibacillus sp. NKC19-16]|nr:metallophosphoesterase [Virgibacillus sp. NKC19-16]UJL48193.1 metallophosphoesterase [Virgibacillus sp. NKC19-16]